MRISKVLFLLLVCVYLFTMGRIAVGAIRPSVRDYMGGCRYKDYRHPKYLSACFLHYFYR